MPDLKFAVLGTGFWSRFQIAGWHEVGGVQPVALYNRTRPKAEATASWIAATWPEIPPPRVYDDAEQLLSEEQLDFADVITEVPGHAPLVFLAARHRVPVICQKPMAPDYETACAMVRACRDAGVPFFVHENFRWQRPIRVVKEMIEAGRIGRPFRASLHFVFHRPFVFENQPLLKQVERLALADVGSHLFDLARFYFGEPSSIYCETLRVRPDIRGEDVATAILGFDNERGRVICTCHMSYTTRTEHEQFPQTLLHIEGTEATIELGPDYWVRLTTDEGTLARRFPPPRYDWADPDYAVVHASIVPCHANLLAGIRGEPAAETTGEDNLNTMRLVYGAYDSAATGRVIHLDYGDCP